MEFGKETFILRAENMESNLFRGLFRVSSPRPEAIRVAPPPIEPTENIYYEIPSGMIEKLLANPYAGDGTLHPDLHLIYVDEVCGLFKLAGVDTSFWHGQKHNYEGHKWKSAQSEKVPYR